MVRRDEGLSLVAVGQALIKRDLRQYGEEAFRQVQSIIQSADLRFTNFEATINGRHGGWPTKDHLCAAAGPEVLDALKSIGFNILSLANNHSFDLGPGGILSTLEEADQRGFLLAGAGVDLTAASRPGYMETAKGRVALVAMDCSGQPDYFYALDATERIPSRPGVNRQRTVLVGGRRMVEEQDAERNLSAIGEAAGQSEFVIAYLHNHHWEERIEETPQWLQEFAHRCIDGGADAFIVHGVPLLQGVEIYRGRPIFYGLGNFIFHSYNVTKWTERTNGRAWDSVIATCRFDQRRELVGLELVPITAGGDREAVLQGSPFGYLDAPRVEHGERGAEILERVARLSERFGTRIRGGAGSGEVVLA